MIHSVIVKKTFNHNFLSVLLVWIAFQFSSLLDTMLSGTFFNTEALTAVGLTSAYSILIYVIMDSLCVGCEVCIGNYAGRGDTKQVNQFFSVNVILMLSIGMAFTLISLIFPESIAFIIGARDESIKIYVVPYVRAFGFCIIPYGLNYLFTLIMLINGKKRLYIINATIFIVLNVTFSLFFVKVLGMGVEGLAFGTVTAYSVCLIHSMFCCVSKKLISFTFKIQDTRKKIKTLLLRSTPTFANNSTELVNSLILNNVVEISIGVHGLTILALYFSLQELVYIVLGALDETVSSTVSVMFGARDTNGIKQIIKSSCFIPMISCVVITTLMVLFRGTVFAMFGEDDLSLINEMLPFMISLIFCTCGSNILYMLSPLYANTDNIKYGIICAITEDTLIAVPIASILTIVVGINGLWIGGVLSFPIFAVVLYLLIKNKIKRKPRTLDDLMMLPKEYYDDTEVMAISIKKNMTEAVSIAEKIQTFLLEKGVDKKKAFFTALCIEELSALIKEASKNNSESYIDIQVFMSNDSVRLSIRDNGPACNYLLHEMDDSVSGIGIKIVKNVAQEVKYVNLLGMNMLNIKV